MARKPVGVMVVSLDLETAAYTNAQKKILAESKEAAATINANFQRLGVTSDQIYAAMASRAELAFRKIGLSSKASLAEVERSYAAMVTSINTANQQMAKNPLFETLGIRSHAAIEAQKKAVIDSFEAIKTIGFKSDQERIVAQRAMNNQIKTLNKEMVGDHEMSMASMTRAVLRWYAAIYVAQAALQFLSIPFIKGFKAVEEYNTAIASMAAMVVTFGQNMRGLSLEDQWKGALAYSTAMIPVLEKIAAKTLLSGQETIALANAFARSGVFLDANNAKQIDAFTKISNALPLMTQGQEITRQINTEVRSLMTGMNVQSSMMLITLREIDPEIEKHMAQWRATDTVLEHIGELLKGFGPATEILEKQWQAVKTSLDTTVNQILRGAMKQSYEDIIALTQELDKWLQTNKQSISDTVDQLRATAKMLKVIYDAAPSGTFEAASMGIIGKILWGNQAGLMIAAISLVNTKLKETGNNLGALPKKAFDAWDAIKNIGTRPGLGETIVPPIPMMPLTQQEKANLNVIKIMKMMDETINKNHKESIAEYNKQTKLQSSAFKEAGASEDYINKYLAKRNILKEQQFSLDKKSNDAAKKAADDAKHLKEAWDATALSLQQKIDTAPLDNFDKELKDLQYEIEKLRKQPYANMALIDKYQLAEETKIVTKWQDDFDKRQIHAAENYQKQEEAKAKSIIKGQEAVDRAAKELAMIPQKEADEARKMVTFYNDLNNMEDEYRNAKLNWIEKEANAKFAGMNAEVAKAKWVAAEKAKLAREEMDSVATKFDYDNKYVNETIANTGKMLDAAMTMYDKDSNEYKRLGEAKKAVQIAELAMTAAKNAQIVASNISVMMSNAGSAVTGAAIGVGPTGFATAAAMIALMASVFAMYGIANGGGGGSATSIPSQAYGLNTPILGGANNQGSESIANSYKLLEDTYKMEDTKLTGIYNQMKNLNQNITGLVNNILRTGGNFTGTSLKTAGFAENNFAKITPNYWMNELSGSFYNKITFGISGAVDNFLGKIGNKIFGGSSETSLTASGISVGAGSLGDLINGTKLLVQSFADLRKETDGGWFHSDRTEIWTEYKTLDESISNMMTNVFKSMGTTMLELNKSLGTNANETAIKAYQFDIGKIDLKGLDGEAISKKISEAISNVGDKMAKDLFGSIVGTYQKINEGLLETAIRLMINKEVVQDTLAMTGQAFVGSTEDILAFSESIISMAGDLDTLRTAAETYYDKFFTDAEKQARLQDQLIKGMAGVNQILPAARDGYRGLLESLDLNTDAGKEAYITMLKLAKSADEYYTALEDVAKKQDEVVASLRKQSQTITQWLSDLNRSPLAPSNSMEAVSTEYNRLKGLAKGTGATEADTSSYLNYAKEYLDYMRKYGGDYKALYASVVSDVQGLQSTIDTKVSDAQLVAANALSAAAALLGSAGNAIINAANAQTIILAGGQATGYYSPKVGWTGGAQLYTNPGQTLQDAINNAIQMGYTQENPWAGGFAATATAEDVIANTTTNQDVWDWSNWSDSQTLINAGLGGYADGGYHEGGWRMVGERGPELEFTPPSRIFNNKQTMNILDNLGLNGGSNGPGNDRPIIIENHLIIDGKEIGAVVTKQIPRNGDLKEEIWRAAH